MLYDNTTIQSIFDFSVRLFKEAAVTKENVLISPISLLYVLALTQYGARGNTLAQMEAVTGADADTLIRVLGNIIPDMGETLRAANAVLLNDDAAINYNHDFLNALKNSMNTGLFKGIFDEKLCIRINDWVNSQTRGQISRIIDHISPTSLMYIFNALTFNAPWETQYSDSDISKHTFTTETGRKQTTTFLFSEEKQYLSDKYSYGFMKPYADKNYAFVALLPNYRVSFNRLISTLTGEQVQSLLNNAQNRSIRTGMPKFALRYELNPVNILNGMGIIDAFSDKADFSGIADSCIPVYINQASQMCTITLDEYGTKCAAVTYTILTSLSGMYVCLDRPFMYMIIDTHTKLPLFMGTIRKIPK